MKIKTRIGFGYHDYPFVIIGKHHFSDNLRNNTWVVKYRGKYSTTIVVKEISRDVLRKLNQLHKTIEIINTISNNYIIQGKM